MLLTRVEHLFGRVTIDVLHSVHVSQFHWQDSHVKLRQFVAIKVCIMQRCSVPFVLYKPAVDAKEKHATFTVQRAAINVTVGATHVRLLHCGVVQGRATNVVRFVTTGDVQHRTLALEVTWHLRKHSQNFQLFLDVRYC